MLTDANFYLDFPLLSWRTKVAVPELDQSFESYKKYERYLFSKSVQMTSIC